MYWLDGSSQLPYTLKGSYLSMRRAKAIALAMDLIENQGRIVEFCVKIGNFDHWCIEASDLVDLMMDLVTRGEIYLQRDGLSTLEDSLCQILRLNSQYVNSVSQFTFEKLFWMQYPKLPYSDGH